MASWIGQHRETLVLVLAATAVLIPLLIGAARGQVPKQIVAGWGVPLAAGTFFLALSLRWVDQFLDPLARLIVSLLFGFVWLVAGMQTVFLQPGISRDMAPEAARAAKTLGWIFMGFGVVWIALSIFKHR